MEIQNAKVGDFKYKNEPATLVQISTNRIPNEEYKACAIKTQKYWKETNIEELYNLMPKQQGRGIMRGSGLVQHQSAPKAERKTKAIRITGKIEKPMEYVPFGRYAINKFKLNDGILMFK